jgi:DNA segregation ATPase FtsK/SpoIIIE-like protein
LKTSTLLASFTNLLGSPRKDSTTQLKRRLRVGNGPAARLINLMEQDGIVGATYRCIWGSSIARSVENKSTSWLRFVKSCKRNKRTIGLVKAKDFLP